MILAKLIVTFLPTLDTPGYGSVADARINFDLLLNHMSQCFEEKNQKISPFIEVSNNELMRSLVTGKTRYRKGEDLNLIDK